MMNQEKHIMLIGKLNLRQQCIKSSLCDYSYAYILVKGTITVDDTSAADAAANNTKKK